MISSPYSIPQMQFQRIRKNLTPSTPLPALASVKRNGKSYLARVDKASDRTGHLFARVTFADGFSMWTNATNVEVV